MHTKAHWITQVSVASFTKDAMACAWRYVKTISTTTNIIKMLPRSESMAGTRQNSARLHRSQLHDLVNLSEGSMNVEDRTRWKLSKRFLQWSPITNYSSKHLIVFLGVWQNSSKFNFRQFYQRLNSSSLERKCSGFSTDAHSYRATPFACEVWKPLHAMKVGTRLSTQRIFWEDSHA